MNTNRPQAFKYSLALISLVVLTHWCGTPAAMSQELIEPRSLAHLVSALKLNRREKSPLRKMDVPGYIRLINRYGVDFPMTEESEKEIRRAGAYFKTADMDRLINAVRRNYRPDEPSEAEMKEAVLQTMETRGGQRNSDGAIEAANPIAGVRIELSKFRKVGCAPPTFGPGYFCTYNVTIPVTFFGNDGSEATDKHMKAFNVLLGLFTNGVPVTERITSKFVWNHDRWLVLPIQ